MRRTFVQVIAFVGVNVLVDSALAFIAMLLVMGIAQVVRLCVALYWPVSSALSQSASAQTNSLYAFVAGIVSMLFVFWNYRSVKKFSRPIK